MTKPAAGPAVAGDPDSRHTPLFGRSVFTIAPTACLGHACRKDTKITPASSLNSFKECVTSFAEDVLNTLRTPWSPDILEIIAFIKINAEFMQNTHEHLFNRSAFFTRRAANVNSAPPAAEFKYSETDEENDHNHDPTLCSNLRPNTHTYVAGV
jgi:hypothetical protein